MNACDFITIGPLTIPREALHAVLDAERRGVQLEADGDSIVVNPPGILTDEERNALRRWRWHVLALLAVCQRCEVH